MTYDQVKATLGSCESKYMIGQSVIMRNGKYTSGMHYKDGYTGMLFETIMEIDEVGDDYSPLSKEKVRSLIRAFNKLTASTVPDVWADSI